MTNLSKNVAQNPFDAIKRIDKNGNEYWSAKDLMQILEYSKWQRFVDAIDRAKFACQNSGESVEKHYADAGLYTRGVPSDYHLSRFACYLIAMNGDPRKQAIASAQSYFAIKTREAEVVIPAQQDRIRELELELELAKALTQKAIAEKAILDTRHLITATCPEIVQQKILGYSVIEKIEYRDRIIKDNQVINDGGTINKTELCRRYGILTRNGKPDYKQLNCRLDKLGITDMPDAWESSPVIQENLQLKRDILPLLDKKILEGDRQRFLGE
jgi:hypothetical protein